MTSPATAASASWTRSRSDNGVAVSARYPLKADPYSSHSIIAREVRRIAALHPRRPLTVLDAGCGPGSLGALLKGAPVSLVGIDGDTGLLKRASGEGYARVLHGDLEADALPPLEASVDVLVLADVLEHCRRPEGVLRRLLDQYLAPSGQLLVSLPNVANAYVRFQLLFGRWEYADRGILDRTHMRFFTGATSRRLLREAGVSIDRRLVTPLPLPEVSPLFKPSGPLFWLHALSALTARVWPSLLAYQYIYSGVWVQ